MTLDDVPQSVREAERRSKHHEADVVVVGAGVFGCAAAFAFANQGRSVILLERWMHEPDRIVGELLQPGGVAALRKLGLEQCLEGIDAIPCYGYHVIYHGDDVAIPYPVVDADGNVLNNGKQDSEEKQALNQTHKRPEGRAFHHGRFIMKLREACAAHPNITIFETTVTSTIDDEHSSQVLGVAARTTDKDTGEKKADFFFGGLTIIADGYDSKFRKQYIGRTPIVRSKFYALELIDCPCPPQGFGHVVIGKASPVLLYQIGTHETRALFDVPEKLAAASPQNGGVRGYIQNTVLPTLPATVRPSVVAALADGRIPKSMPNSWLPPAKQTQHAGVLVLGDAYNMRHPLTGGGMTVAFNDVVLLAELLSPEKVPVLADSAAVQAAMAEFHWRRKALTSIINVLAQALYSLFSAQDRQLLALQMGCFRYFQMGITDQPMGLMGGMIQRPLVLAYHFFSVAFVAIWCNAVAVCGGSLLGLWKLPLAIVDAVLILWRASVVFLPVLWTESR
ncbi:squalene epoxidase-domain-containing protein [Cercophora scortea]|uniref:Squalene monooxygenase n=1 Tax=Cercophora scortea TaxID=314031 RepID=A0AAE0IFE5_9PEZI|nr:squalene epoxidase-domain-containing protein [Cercophora scortea]